MLKNSHFKVTNTEKYINSVLNPHTMVYIPTSDEGNTPENLDQTRREVVREIAHLYGATRTQVEQYVQQCAEDPIDCSRSVHVQEDEDLKTALEAESAHLASLLREKQP